MNCIRVLFVCTGNSARSQMAEAFVREYGGNRFEAFSAGLEPREIHPMTVRVMEEVGIDLGSHSSKHLDTYMGKMHFSYVITVCSHADASCPSVFPGAGKRLYWNFEDPAASQGTDEINLEKFRQIRDQISNRIKAWVQEISIAL